MNIIYIFGINNSVLMVFGEIFCVILYAMYFLPDNRRDKVRFTENLITQHSHITYFIVINANNDNAVFGQQISC